MQLRVRTAIVALAVFIPFVVYGGLPLELFMVGVGVITLHELFAMMGVERSSAEGLVGMGMMLAILVPGHLYSGFPPAFDALHLYYVGATILMLIMLYKTETVNYYVISGIAFAALYVGYGYHYFLETREMGLYALLYVLVLIFSNDSLAYLIGVRFGRHKLAPKVSPNKTIEGSLGGVVGAVAATSIALCFEPVAATMQISQGQNLILSVILAIVGQLGDLAESAIKRYFGVKDSGWILPGHGGLLDRFDNLLLVLPVFHMIMSFF